MIELQTASHCPIVKMILGKSTTRYDTEKYLSELSDRISKEELFGVIMICPYGQPSQERGCQKIERNWLSTYKLSLTKYCFGVALVTDSWVVSSVFSPIIKQLIKHFLSVEFHIFDSHADAQIWLMDKYLSLKF